MTTIDVPVVSTPAPAGVRAQAAPHAAVGLLVIAAAAVHGAAQLADAEATVAASVAGIAVVLAVVAATVTGRRIACRKARARVVAFVAVAGTWLATMTATGVSLGAVGLLAAMVYALSLHWWSKRRIPNAAAPVTAAPQDGDLYARWWAQYVGGKGCVLEHSRLQSPQTIPAGTRYVLQLVKGKQTYGGVLGKLEEIRGALDLLPEHDLIVERHPVLSASNLLLTIVTRSPIKDSVTWPGPSAFNSATGCVALGPYVDGEDVASWRVYTDNSLWGGYMTGSSGSGKSRMFESLALAMAASNSHPTVVMFCDGDEGASSPMLMKHADHVALDEDLSQARLMLAGALLLMQVRRQENIAYGLEGFTPTDDRPGVMIFIDECHLIFIDDGCRAMAAEITRRGRKVGVNIIAASQIGTLDAFGGQGAENGDVLRSSLRAGNAVILRSLTNNTKVVFGVDIDPTQFPELPGYAYYVAGKGSAGRTAPFRGYYVDNAARDYWPTRIHWRSLSQGEGNAWGHGYTRRKATAETARLDALQHIQDAKAGRRPTPATDQPIAYTIPIPARATVAQFPTWDPTSARPDAPKVGDIHTRLANAITTGDVLTDGYCKPGRVAEYLDCTPQWAGKALTDLTTLGVLKKGDTQGRYYPTGVTLDTVAA